MSAALTHAVIYHFRHELPVPVETVMGALTARSCVLLRLEDAEGAHGWGEIWSNFPPDGDYHRARLAAKILPAALAGLSCQELTNETGANSPPGPWGCTRECVRDAQQAFDMRCASDLGKALLVSVI